MSDSIFNSSASILGGGAEQQPANATNFFAAPTVPPVLKVELAFPPGFVPEGDASSGVTVKLVKPGKNADLSGVVKVGMKILSINGTSVVGLTVPQAVVLIKQFLLLSALLGGLVI